MFIARGLGVLLTVVRRWADSSIVQLEIERDVFKKVRESLKQPEKKEERKEHRETCETVIERFYFEFNLVEMNLERGESIRLREAMGLLENFIIYCKDKDCVLRHLLVVALTACNNYLGYGMDFPTEAVPLIHKQCAVLINKAIIEAAISRAQEAYALGAARDLLEVLISRISLENNQPRASMRFC